MSETPLHRTPVRLVLLNGPTKGKTFNIEEGENLIGRWDPDAAAFPEVDLDADDVDAKISRKHAMIERRGKKVYLTDLGSLNGTFINRGPRLDANKRQELNADDEIIIGKTFLGLQIDPN